jgi:hypothetical protein
MPMIGGGPGLSQLATTHVMARKDCEYREDRAEIALIDCTTGSSSVICSLSSTISWIWGEPRATGGIEFAEPMRPTAMVQDLFHRADIVPVVLPRRARLERSAPRAPMDTRCAACSA